MGAWTLHEGLAAWSWVLNVYRDGGGSEVCEARGGITEGEMRKSNVQLGCNTAEGIAKSTEGQRRDNV